jgi:BMFP domain-containing protein YqiC
MQEKWLLEDLLEKCTVRIHTDSSHGTGFFVAEKLILTCYHVVEKSNGISIFWKETQKKYEAIVKYQIEDYNIDLALLEIIDDSFDENHPCVYLGPERSMPGDSLASFGYPENSSCGDTVTFKYEGTSNPGKENRDQHWLHKIKGGEANYGLSGAPLLNTITEKVCGIICISRGPGTDLGARATPTAIIFKNFSELEGNNQSFHEKDRRWKSRLLLQLEDLQPKYSKVIYFAIALISRCLFCSCFWFPFPLQYTIDLIYCCLPFYDEKTKRNHLGRINKEIRRCLEGLEDFKTTKNSSLLSKLIYEEFKLWLYMLTIETLGKNESNTKFKVSEILESLNSNNNIVQANLNQELRKGKTLNHQYLKLVKYLQNLIKSIDPNNLQKDYQIFVNIFNEISENINQQLLPKKILENLNNSIKKNAKKLSTKRFILLNQIKEILEYCINFYEKKSFNKPIVQDNLIPTPGTPTPTPTPATPSGKEIIDSPIIKYYEDQIQLDKEVTKNLREENQRLNSQINELSEVLIKRDQLDIDKKEDIKNIREENEILKSQINKLEDKIKSDNPALSTTERIDDLPDNSTNQILDVTRRETSSNQIDDKISRLKTFGELAEELDNLPDSSTDPIIENYCFQDDKIPSNDFIVNCSKKIVNYSQEDNIPSNNSIEQKNNQQQKKQQRQGC